MNQASRIREIGSTVWAPGDWIGHMAEALGVTRRTVQRWGASEVDPGEAVFADLRKIAADRCRQITEIVQERG